MREIPFVPSVPFQTIGTVLNNESITIDLHWNTRDEAWYFHLTDDKGDSIIKGIKIVIATPLGRSSAHEFFSRNLLIAMDISGQQREATLDDLGTRVIMLHYTSDELANGTDIGARETL